jgi:hypothetical protein
MVITQILGSEASADGKYVFVQVMKETEGKVTAGGLRIPSIEARGLINALSDGIDKARLARRELGRLTIVK